MNKAEYPVWLAVMPDQRDAARLDAGKHPDGGSAIAWSKEDQLWFARPGADLSRIKNWLPDSTIRSSGGGDPHSEFLDALTGAGLVLDGLPVMDGKRHRVPVVEGKKGNRDGVYRGFLDGIKPAGWYINYHRADNDKDIIRWKASGSIGEADPVARLHMRAAMRQTQDNFAREQAALYARQTDNAKQLYDRLPVADADHGYLIRKGVTASDDIRQTRNGALVIPFYDADGVFRTLQYIPPDGDKYLFKDAPKVGHFRVEGNGLRNGDPILYAEGYATARSLHMITGLSVVMTIDAGNMQAVADVLKARYPNSPHLFMADVDHSKEKNKGVLSAERSALSTGGAVLLPDLTKEEKDRGFTDFNDLHQYRGIELLRKSLLPNIERALNGLNFKDNFMANTPEDMQPQAENVLKTATDITADTPQNGKEVSKSPAVEAATAGGRRPGSAKEKEEQVLALRGQGVGAAQIAEQLGIGQTSVYRIFRANPVTEMKESTHDTAVADLEGMASASSTDVSVSTVDAATVATKKETSEVKMPPADKPVMPELPSSGHETMTVASPESSSQSTGKPAVVNAASTDSVSETPSAEGVTNKIAVPEIQPDAEPSPDVSASTPLNTVDNEENAIFVGARRVSPADDDLNDGQLKSRIDADRLLSRVTHELQPDGKSVLYKLDNEPAFIDRGNRLVMAEGASTHEEKVLAALLTASNHYHGRIELTGSDEFKAFAISVIVANKLDVSMKNASQQADLDAARRVAEQPVAPVDSIRGNPESPRADVASPAMSQGPEMTRQPVMSTDIPRSYEQPVMPSQTGPATHQLQPEDKALSSSIHTPAEKAREPVTGKVTACGQAPFRFETGAAESTFISLRTREGTQTFWGKELAGLIRETNLKPGRMVSLQWMGNQPVTVQVPQKDADGIVTHYKSVDTKRNQWSLVPRGGDRVQTGGPELVPLSAFDVNRYSHIQQRVIQDLNLHMPAPPRPTDGLYWLKANGQGSTTPGDALSAERPPQSERAGSVIMSAWGADGSPDLYLVQGDGNYLQGVMRQGGEYKHVLVSLPDSKEAPPMVVNLLTPEGAVPIGSGNGINRSNGQSVPREHVVIRLTGDDKQRIAKLDAPADIPPALHARLGYDERYKPEANWSKEQPAAAPQAAPVSPPRPAQ